MNMFILFRHFSGHPPPPPPPHPSVTTWSHAPQHFSGHRPPPPPVGNQAIGRQWNPSKRQRIENRAKNIPV